MILKSSIHASSSAPRFMLASGSYTEPLATLTRASAGQFVNQSIVQQLTNEGNIRKRDLKTSPSGDIAITI